MPGQNAAPSSSQSSMHSAAISAPNMVTSSSELNMFGFPSSGQNTTTSTTQSVGQGLSISGLNTGLVGPPKQGGQAKTGLSSSPQFQGFQSAGMDDDDDFGDFHSSTSSLENSSNSSNVKTETATTTSLTSSLDSYKFQTESKTTLDLSASLESFKLKTEFDKKAGKATSLESFQLKTEHSLFTSVKPPPPPAATQSSNTSGAKLSTSLTDVSPSDKALGDKEKEKLSGFAAFPALAKPPSFGDSPNSLPNKISAKDNTTELGHIGSEHQGGTTDNYDLFHSSSLDKNEENNTTGIVLTDTNPTQQKTSDKYDFLRSLDGNVSTIFAAPEPSRKQDNSFGDFEGFEHAESNTNDAFGNFQSNTSNSDFQTPGNLSAPPSSQNSSSNMNDNWNAFESAPSTQNEPNFASFGSVNKVSSDDDFGDFSQPQTTQPGVNPSSNFGDFFSANHNANGVNASSFGDEGRQRSGSAMASFTSAVPLDSTQRYKQLCGEVEVRIIYLLKD